MKFEEKRNLQKNCCSIDTRLGTPPFKQCPNATISVGGQIYCLSQHVNGQYIRSDSQDRKIGTVLSYPINGHQYTIIGKTKNEHGENAYLLVCYEKKGPFFSVDPIYGQILVENKKLNNMSFNATSNSDTSKKRGFGDSSKSVPEMSSKKHASTGSFFPLYNQENTAVDLSSIPQCVRVWSS